MNIGKWEASVFEFSGLSTSAICNFVLPRCVFIVADIAAYLGIGLDRLGQQRGGQVLFGKGWNPGRRLAPGRDRRLCLRTTLFCLDGVGHGKRAVPGKSGPPRGIWEPEGDPLGFSGPFRELVFGVVIRLGFPDHSES